jgi:hypothetical protein
MSFLLDPPMLVVTGAAIERVTSDPRAADRLSWLTIGVYYAVSVPLWLDSSAKPLELFWKPLGSSGPRDFMVNSGILDLPVPKRPTARQHLTAAAILATYPLFLHAGRALARRQG